MGIHKYKPTTPGRRSASVPDFVELTRSAPEKPLLVPKPKTGDHDNSGHITTRHIGDGYKQAYRIIGFKCYDKDEVPMKVAHIEYDPSRITRTALLHYRDGEGRYIIAPNGLTQGTVAVSGPGSDIKSSNNLELWQVPIGTTVHAVELRPRSGTRLGRSAGVAIQLIARESKYTTLRMSSDEMHMIGVRCRVTIDTVDSAEQSNISWGKAGRSRWKDIRPTVRGVAMNPVDHPHGGGEGRTSGGRHPVSPRGKPEGHTRDKNKASSRLIVHRHKTGKKR